MIHVLSDDPDGGERLEQLRRELGDQQLQQFNTSVFDGQKLAFEELGMACEAMPFLAERRLVLVRGLLSRFEAKPGAKEQRREGGGAEERKIPELARQLRDYLPRLPSSTELVFVEAVAITKQNPLHKSLVAAGARLAQTPVLQAEALVGWIERRVAAKGGRLAARAARLLASFGVANLNALDHELDKLVAYAGEAEIDARAISQLVDAARELNVYKMSDAIAGGDAGQALRRLHELLDEGQHPLYILTMIGRHFRLLIQIKDLRARGLRPADIAARLRVPPFVVETLTRQLRRYPAFEQLEHVYRRLLESDVAAKTGRRDLVLNLELLIAELDQRR